MFHVAFANQAFCVISFSGAELVLCGCSEGVHAMKV